MHTGAGVWSGLVLVGEVNTGRVKVIEWSSGNVWVQVGGGVAEAGSTPVLHRSVGLVRLRCGHSQTHQYAHKRHSALERIICCWYSNFSCPAALCCCALRSRTVCSAI